jgi:hypothetical protein
LAKCADFEVIETTSAMGSSVSAWTLFPSFGHGFPEFWEASEEGNAAANWAMPSPQWDALFIGVVGSDAGQQSGSIFSRVP